MNSYSLVEGQTLLGCFSIYLNMTYLDVKERPQETGTAKYMYIILLILADRLALQGRRTFLVGKSYLLHLRNGVKW